MGSSPRPVPGNVPRLEQGQGCRWGHLWRALPTGSSARPRCKGSLSAGLPAPRARRGSGRPRSVSHSSRAGERGPSFPLEGGGGGSAAAAANSPRRQLRVRALKERGGRGRRRVCPRGFSRAAPWGAGQGPGGNPPPAGESSSPELPGLCQGQAGSGRGWRLWGSAPGVAAPGFGVVLGAALCWAPCWGIPAPSQRPGWLRAAAGWGSTLGWGWVSSLNGGEGEMWLSLNVPDQVTVARDNFVRSLSKPPVFFLRSEDWQLEIDAERLLKVAELLGQFCWAV